MVRDDADGHRFELLVDDAVTGPFFVSYLRKHPEDADLVRPS